MSGKGIAASLAMPQQVISPRSPVVVTQLTHAADEHFVADGLSKEAKKIAIQRAKTYLPTPSQLHVVPQLRGFVDRRKKLLDVKIDFCL
jgi:hypothetical protein